MTIIAVPVSSALGGSYTLQDVVTAIRVDLKDEQAGTYDNSVLLKFVNDGISVLHSILSNFAPNLFIEDVTLSLTVAGGNGPYPIDAAAKNLKRIEYIKDHNGEKISKISGQPGGSLSNGAPLNYWLQGFGPTNVYFNSVPDQNYSYVAGIIRSIARSTDITDTYPMPDSTFTAIVSWCSYVALNYQEYTTMKEEERVALIMQFLGDDLLTMGNAIDFTVDAGFPNDGSDSASQFNPLNL